MNLFCLLLAAIAAPFTLSFEDAAVPGVQGQAAFFDGFDSRVVVPASQVPTPERHFTVDVWACPLAFPKSPCPLVCRIGGAAPSAVAAPKGGPSASPDAAFSADWADAAAGGWALWLDATGRVHFQVASAGEWVAVESLSALPLRAWSRITAQFRAGAGLYLAVDGREVAKAACELPWVNQAEFPLWLGRAPFKTSSFFENQHIPIYSSFDGVLDELTIDTDKQAYARILKEKFVRPAAPGSEVPGFAPRRLPSGPEGLAFGAWYIPLRFYPAYDARWRGETPDVVVGFGEARPWKVVFWRGISYAPCFVTEKGNWMSNEFVERKKVTGWGCCESMSDKHADFSSVRILENTPARTVVQWRHAPVGVNLKFPYRNEETQWGDWSEETYIFYPDGAGVRKMEVWTSRPQDWYEWCQSLQVLHPDQRPEDVLDASRIMSVAAMDGRSETYAWNFEGKRRQDEPSLDRANIQVTYLKSRWNPYLILEDGDGLNEKGQVGAAIDRYAGRWSDYSDFPWRNHWPVTQDYVIGRYACVADAAAHTYTATQYNPVHSCEKVSDAGDGVWKMTKLMLCGCTEGDAASLLPLAHSWLDAPKMVCQEANGLAADVPYDRTQRAYVLTVNPDADALVFRVEASSRQPVHGLCLVLKGLARPVSAITVNGQACEAARIGRIEAWDGVSTLVWLPQESEKPIDLNLQ